MKLGYDLVIEQTQKLSMTPELIQAIQILQFNNAELNEFVEKEVLENPVLELENRGDSHLDLIEKLSQSDYLDKSFRQWEYSKQEDEDDFSMEKFVSQEETLEDHLLVQLNFSDIGGREKEAARFLIESIDENGYLTMELDEVSSQLEISLDECQRALECIQALEPAGVGARSLKECLLLQLKSRGISSPDVIYVIENMLEDVAGNRIAKMAKSLSGKTTRIQEIIDIIRSLEPKPGRKFSSGESTRYVTPDIYVEEDNGEYVVVTNDGSLPRLMISSYYNKLAKTCEKEDDVSKYLNDRINSALWLIKSIEQRKDTIYSVAKEIVSYQQDFFSKGDKYIRPLTLKQIADKISMHESTISRSINGKYMLTPRGMYEMKYFFSSSVGEAGEEISSKRIKSFIKDYISKEDSKKPLSDSDIVEMLKTEDINISRRTVAKYREGLNIPSSSKRRRF